MAGWLVGSGYTCPNYYNVPTLATGVFLQLKTALEQGKYNVVLRVYDQLKMYQDSSIQATVCDCTGDEVRCTDKLLEAGMPLSGVLGILGGILALLCM